MDTATKTACCGGSSPAATVQKASIQSKDPVCGMTVDPDAARARGLTSHYDDADYFFCGRGCKLDFDEDPGKYLDPSHRPSM